MSKSKLPTPKPKLEGKPAWDEARKRAIQKKLEDVVINALSKPKRRNRKRIDCFLCNGTGDLEGVSNQLEVTTLRCGECKGKGFKYE